MVFSTPHLTVPIPAIQGQFGDRIATYTTQVTPQSIVALVGHDPRSARWKSLSADIREIYERLQRKTSKNRIQGLTRYFEHRFCDRPIAVGALPSISIASQAYCQFEPIPGYETQGVGTLHFNLDSSNQRIVVDGLARITAALAIKDISENDEDLDVRDEMKKLLTKFVFPCVIYVPLKEDDPLELEDLQQLFHDFNFKAEPIKAKDAIALDHSDLYIALTNRLGKADVFAENGGMEKRAASLGKKSTALAVQMNVLRFIRAATEGEGFLEATTRSTVDDPNVTIRSIDAIEGEVIEFLDAFAVAMGEQFTERDAIHLMAPGWGSLGVIYHDLRYKLNVPDIKASAKALGVLDWSRSAPLWTGIVSQRVDKEGNGVVNEDGTPALTLTAGGGSRNRRAVTTIARRAIGLEKLLIDKGFIEQADLLAA